MAESGDEDESKDTECKSKEEKNAQTPPKTTTSTELKTDVTEEKTDEVNQGNVQDIKSEKLKPSLDTSKMKTDLKYPTSKLKTQVTVPAPAPIKSIEENAKEVQVSLDRFTETETTEVRSVRKMLKKERKVMERQQKALKSKRHKKAADVENNQAHVQRVLHENFLKKHINILDGDDIEYDAVELTKIINDVKMIIMKEPSLLEVPIPCVIVGDIHGQYDDLQRIFMITGKNNRSGATLRRYVFLGDYVDRGPNSLECICCLFAHKLIFPKMFNLLRGNHESAFINRNYGFYQELVDRFEEEMGSRLWCLFNDVFDLLPLAALVHKRILCMHGGLSPHLNSLDDIRKIIRPIKTMEESPLACDLLWSDPVVSLSGFVKNIVRGISVCFGEDSVLKACEKLNLDLIVRAHQMMINGFSFFCKRKMVTVFSAPRYDAEKNNKGAVMVIDKNMKAGFLLLHPVTADGKGVQSFIKSYTRMSSEPCYTAKEILSDEKKITTYDPTEVYDAQKMKSIANR